LILFRHRILPRKETPVAKKREEPPRDERAPEPSTDKGGQNFNHLGDDIRRVVIGLAVCGGILILLKLSGM